LIEFVSQTRRDPHQGTTRGSCEFAPQNSATLCNSLQLRACRLPLQVVGEYSVPLR